MARGAALGYNQGFIVVHVIGLPNGWVLLDWLIMSFFLSVLPKFFHVFFYNWGGEGGYRH